MTHLVLWLQASQDWVKVWAELHSFLEALGKNLVVVRISFLMVVGLRSHLLDCCRPTAALSS